MATLEAKARSEGVRLDFHVRIGREGTAGGMDVYLDLANRDGQAAKISALGWSIVDRPPVLFQRPEGLLPLPVPVRGGSIELLRPYVNLSEA